MTICFNHQQAIDEQINACHSNQTKIAWKKSKNGKKHVQVWLSAQHAAMSIELISVKRSAVNFELQNLQFQYDFVIHSEICVKVVTVKIDWLPQ